MGEKKKKIQSFFMESDRMELKTQKIQLQTFLQSLKAKKKKQIPLLPSPFWCLNYFVSILAFGTFWVLLRKMFPPSPTLFRQIIKIGHLFILFIFFYFIFFWVFSFIFVCLFWIHSNLIGIKIFSANSQKLLFYSFLVSKGHTVLR